MQKVAVPDCTKPGTGIGLLAILTRGCNVRKEGVYMKRILSLIVLVCLVGGLTACGGDSPAPTNHGVNAPAPAAGQTDGRRPKEADYDIHAACEGNRVAFALRLPPFESEAYGGSIGFGEVCKVWYQRGDYTDLSGKLEQAGSSEEIPGGEVKLVFNQETNTIVGDVLIPDQVKFDWDALPYIGLYFDANGDPSFSGQHLMDEFSGTVEEILDLALTTGEKEQAAQDAERDAALQSTAVTPDLSAFDAAAPTLTIEYPAVGTMRIIIHDPCLAAAYALEAPLFSYMWEVRLDEGLDTLISVHAEVSSMANGVPAAPIVLDMNQVQNYSSGDGTTGMKSAAVLTMDFEGQNIIWDLEVENDIANRISNCDASVSMLYGSSPDDYIVKDLEIQ